MTRICTCRPMESVGRIGNPSLKAILEDFIPTMPDRFLFGSDHASCSQREHIDFFKSLKLSAESTKKLFSLNAKRIYHLKFS